MRETTKNIPSFGVALAVHTAALVTLLLGTVGHAYPARAADGPTAISTIEVESESLPADGPTSDPSLPPPVVTPPSPRTSTRAPPNERGVSKHTAADAEAPLPIANVVEASRGQTAVGPTSDLSPDPGAGLQLFRSSTPNAPILEQLERETRGLELRRRLDPCPPR